MSLRLRSFLVLLTLCLSAYGAPAYSQSADYFELDPEMLLNAEVTTVSRRSQRIIDVPAAVHVITGEDIRRAGSTSIPDALRLAPGVNVAQADGNSWAVSIRGFNGVLSNKLLVMIDGRSVYNPLFAGTYWELMDLVLEDVDRIEIVRGPGGALWGANAVNGVINIITKPAAHTIGNLATVSIGNNGYRNLAARHGGTMGNQGFYRMYAKAGDHDGFDAEGGGRSPDNSQDYRTGFRADWAEHFTLQGDLYRANSDQLNSTPIFMAPFTVVEEETMQSTGGNILGRWSRSLDGNDLLTVQTYLDYFERSQILLEDNRLTFDIDAQYDLPETGRHQFIIGGGYRVTHDELSGPAAVTFHPDRRTDQIISAFIQDQITLVPKEWFLTLGSKFEQNDYSGFEVQPNARVLWHPAEDSAVWASVSRAVRVPSRLDHDLRQRIGVFAPGALLPGLTEAVRETSREFDAEKLIAYELGYRQQVTSGLSSDIALFYNDYDDLATFGFLPFQAAVNPARTIFPVNTVNGMEAESYGGEVSLSWAVTPSWELTANYSILDIELHLKENNGFALEGAEKQSPQHQAYLGSAWDINQQWSLNTGVFYNDELAAYNVEDRLRLDINLEWRADESLRFNLVGQNLLGGDQREFSSPAALNATEIGSTVYGKATWKF